MDASWATAVSQEQKESEMTSKDLRHCVLFMLIWGIALFLVAYAASFAMADDDGAAPAPSKYSWAFFTETQSVLLKDGQVIGQWYYPTGTYYPWNGVENQAAEKPPIGPPVHGATPPGGIEDWRKNGINRPDRDQTSLSGRPINPSRMAEAFSGLLTDDSDKGYFVIIAKTQKQRQLVLADWKKLPTSFTSRYNVWMAAPDHFSMMDHFSGKPRFFVEGDPTIELMQRDGTVLFRRPQCEQKYRAADMQELLKSDPDYKPELDPGAPADTSTIPSFGATTSLVVVGAGVLLLLFRRKP